MKIIYGTLMVLVLGGCAGWDWSGPLRITALQGQAQGQLWSDQRECEAEGQRAAGAATDAEMLTVWSPVQVATSFPGQARRTMVRCLSERGYRVERIER